MRAIVAVSSVSRKAGGVQDAVRRMTQCLVERGVGMRVLSLMDEFTDSDIGSWAPVQPEVFKPEWPAWFGCSRGLLTTALRDGDADLGHVHGLWELPGVAIHRWAKRWKKPYVVSPHGMLDPWALRNSRWKKRVASLLFEDAHLQDAACLHALCPSEAEAIRQHGLRNPICVIPNGVDLPQKDEPGDPPWRDHHTGVGKKVLLYLGRLHPKKGLADLIEAWSLLRGQHVQSVDEWVLAVAGWGQKHYEIGLEQQVAGRGLRNDVMFLGPLFGSDKACAFRHARAFVLPSHSEGLPLTVLEAWSHARPVLMTPACHLPEGYSRGAAIRADPTAESLAEGLKALMAMTDHQRETMGEKGRALVSERFAWIGIAREMKAVYEWIVGGGQPPPSVRTD